MGRFQRRNFFILCLQVPGGGVKTTQMGKEDVELSPGFGIMNNNAGPPKHFCGGL